MPGRWLSRRVDVGSVLASGEWRRPTLSLASGTPVDGAAPPERPVLYDLVAERARALIAAIGTFTPSEAMHKHTARLPGFRTAGDATRRPHLCRRPCRPAGVPPGSRSSARRPHGDSRHVDTVTQFDYVAVCLGIVEV